MTAVKKNEATGALYDFEDIKLSDKMFMKFAERMYDLAGVDLPLTPKNHALIRNRIVKLLRRHSLKTYEDYWSKLEAGGNEMVSEFISALTTNMTSFYRESNHFDFLKSILPELSRKFGSDLRMWCAAASTGQEPYTIAMTACEAQPEMPSAKPRLLATDIDLQVLKKASTGTYEEREMQGLPPVQRSKYFEKIKADGDEYWRAKDQIHNMIRFAPFNLMNPKYEFQHKFHVIFCRNVLIYFDEPTTKRVIDNLVSCLAPGGYLVLGHSESGNVKHPGLKPMSRAVYQKL
ncbi:CheR family methyltransferase [Bdellovibrio bacteriovorus]|uniref:protein-glutamate O-methyltransferase n=1 Tax=Bdellovibrio bacteriovorus str. Tiberius TaxID=1069642 RepID=K7Z1V0_BDEBC|nr:protein-glutamate O-methyltransferase CheR [Bdellovibrio bacteriovorus]AFY03055.1 chemotaxis protein methyltransferase [Bdellovibrio bacteriovorus str. Tiberius]